MTNERTDLPGDPGEATTVVDILSGYAAAGYDTEMRVTPDGTIQCRACGTAHLPAAMELDSVRRVEGASDPDDMQAVVALRCVCGARGALSLAYGPTAAAEEADVLAALPDHRDASDIPGAQPPSEAAAADTRSRR